MISSLLFFVSPSTFFLIILLSSLGQEPDVHAIIFSWSRQAQSDPSLLQVQAPYFTNYFGIHKSNYPGTIQLRSSIPVVGRHSRRASKFNHSLYSHLTNIHHLTGLTPYTRREVTNSMPSPTMWQCQSMAGTVISHPGVMRKTSRENSSNISNETKQGLTNKHETDIFRILQEGHGVDSYEIDGLIEVCESCNRAFARTALRGHIKSCDEHSGSMGGKRMVVAGNNGE